METAYYHRWQHLTVSSYFAHVCVIFPTCWMATVARLKGSSTNPFSLSSEHSMQLFLAAQQDGIALAQDALL